MQPVRYNITGGEIMRKIFACVFVCVFIFTLSACGMSSTEQPKLTEQEALDIALEQAGVKEENITKLENKLEMDDGILVYEIDFLSGITEYSYDVNADTGEIVERDRDLFD